MYVCGSVELGEKILLEEKGGRRKGKGRWGSFLKETRKLERGQISKYTV